MFDKPTFLSSQFHTINRKQINEHKFRRIEYTRKTISCKPTADYHNRPCLSIETSGIWREDSLVGRIKAIDQARNTHLSPMCVSA